MRKSAFSLFELSIAVLIIGLLIGGIVATSIVITKARISTAVTLTNSAPVNSITGLNVWIESSDDASFLSNQTVSGAGISTWYNKSKSKITTNNATQATSSLQPTYSNAINNIYTIKFDGADDYLNVDGSFLNNSNYTIFVIDKRLSGKSDNYFIGDNLVSTQNQQLILGYSANSTVMHSQSGANSYTSSTPSYVGDKNEPRIFTFTHDSSVGKKTYIDGVLAGQSSNTSNLTNISTLKIGNGYQGEIGEVIMFDRALKNEERQSIESYLSKKWSINSYPNTSCSGSVSYQGCTSCNVSVAGVSTSSVALGSGSLSCSVAGYTGSVSYACSGSGISTSGSCSCTSGYTLVGGTCHANCSVSGITGVVNTTVPAGSSTLSCGQSNFTGSISYTCSGGTLTPLGSCSCASGFTLSGSSCAAIQCTFSGTAGVSNGTVVNYTTSTLTQSCNASGYSGTVSYTCTTTGAPNVSANSCVSGCGTISNGAGGTFDATGLTTNSQYAKKACESVYGVGACTSLACGDFSYWEKSPNTSCSCSTPMGRYQFIYNSPNGATQVGEYYGGQSTSVAGDNLFVRQKGSSGCNANSWILTHKTLASGCPGATD